MIDENSLGSDPWMGAVQPGIDWKITGNSKLKLAAAYYYFQHVKGSVLDYSQGGNNLKAGTSGSDGLEFNFNSISPSAQIEFDHPFDMVNVRIPYLAFFGEYHHNFDADYSNNAWSGGVALGHKKIKKFGDWQLKYINVLLGTNAWVDVFPDSDRYGGRTGVRSHEGIFTLGLSPNWEFGLDYYYSALTTANGLTNDKQQNLIQADLVWKF